MNLKYAEVILPLPISGTFTYGIPSELESSVEHGSRVFVQFGSRKFYTGIISYIHSEKPEGYDVRPIIMVMESNPIVRYPQIRFWEWIAEYYLCSLGEVYKAAVPSGLKVESESYISLRNDYEDLLEEISLNEREKEVIDKLSVHSRYKMSEIEKDSSRQRSFYSAINSLADKGLISIDEVTVSSYKPKIISYVRLAFDPGNNECRHEAFEKVSRSVNQERLLVSYLELLRQNPDKEIERKFLLEKTGINAGILRALIEKGIMIPYKKEVNRFKESASETLSPPKDLSYIQKQKLEEIYVSFHDHLVTLLRGVTGSGKTEIYIHLIKEVIDRGDQVLYLVPEISLTTQLTDRLRSVFGDRLLVYHSKFTDNERVDIWRKLLHTHDPYIILGVRSSIFLPFSHLGLIIIDEEHESSYKQYDPAPRYNARDAAIMLATMHKAKVLLGSATPSIETYYKALNGKYGLVELLERHDSASLPDIEIVDMKQDRKRKENHGIFSGRLYDLTLKALKDGHQAIMFQNRRGFSPIVICKECGWIPKCLNCDVSLVYHKKIGQLRCHYCGYNIPLPSTCPACGQNSIEVFGYGTERIEEELNEAFKNYRVARMDLDTTRNKNSYQEIIDNFSQHKTDILTGTQMISKGLDFENVKIVGIMNADTMLHFPDFRAQERAFNMMVQVAGRAGRRKEKGEVIIQTSNPENNVLKYVRKHDYLNFYNYEIEERQKFNFPPFCKIINLYLKHKDRDTVDQAAIQYTLELKHIFGDRVLGPEPPGISRIANYNLQCIMLKIEKDASIKKVKDILRKVYEKMAYDSRMKRTVVYYDVDPM